ncbi:hypothetical protein J2S08_003446 [Bacillus chungangensis]|uniref:Uncharacterized protein n=1 Tax=Bacillus chungangensis TaxID=587633 RepID=A0ABT9WW88_9BACI|nr:hypothetical protein [Bacillus chungangensis]
MLFKNLLKLKREIFICFFSIEWYIIMSEVADFPNVFLFFLMDKLLVIVLKEEVNLKAPLLATY